MSQTNNNNSQVGISINLGVNGGQEVQQATAQIQELNTTIAATGKTDIAQPVKSLKQELRAALETTSKLAAANQQNTAAYVTSARRVTELRNQIDEMNNSLKAYDPDNKFRVAANAASSATRAVQGYTGAMAFLGLEGEDYAKTLAKLQGISAFADGIDGALDLADSYKDVLRMLGLNLTATTAQTAATATATTIQTAQTAAIQTTTVASKALGMAWKALGIGLIVSAVAYLITNWDSLTASMNKLLPAGKSVGSLFTSIKNGAMGVGQAVLKYITMPFAALTKLLQGDFDGFKKAISDGLSFKKNFNAGVLAAEVDDQKSANRKKSQEDIKHQEDRIKLLKASGADTTKLERDVFNKKLQLNKEDKEKYAETLNEKALFEAGFTKKNNDAHTKLVADKASKEKAATEKHNAELKTQLDAVKKYNTDALKIIADSSKSEKDIALSTVNEKYKLEFDALEISKKTIKDYNSHFKTLTEVRKIEEFNINKKYNDSINDYLKSVQSNTINSYDKTIDEINKVIDEKLKNATPDQKVQLETSRTEQVTKLTTLKTLDESSQAAVTDVTNVENANRPSDTDTPDVAAAKITAINTAKLDAENAAFELKRVQLAGQKQALLQLEAEHGKAITDINESTTQANIDLAAKEKDAKLATIDAVSGGLNTLAGIAGENSIAGKALGLSSAVIDTYVGANKALAQGGIFGAVSAAAIITTGLLNVKKIMSVKIPGSSNGGGSPTFSAPVVNSTVLNQERTGSKDIVSAVSNSNQQPIKAYIVEKDLQKATEKRKTIDNLSTY
jgi:hypothetical protein